MRVLVLYCHPVVESFNAAVHAAVLRGLQARKIVTRVLRVTIRPGAPVRHLACYTMDRKTGPQLAAFLRRIEGEMARF
jgi:NAD(P)H dehydrogenase (quinone)